MAKIGHILLLSLNSVIFYLILTFFILNCFFFKKNRMVSKFISFGLYFGYWHYFCSEASHGLNCAHGPKRTFKNIGTRPGLPLQLISQNKSFQNYRPEPPPPPPPPKYQCFLSDIVLENASVLCDRKLFYSI